MLGLASIWMQKIRDSTPGQSVFFAMEFLNLIEKSKLNVVYIHEMQTKHTIWIRNKFNSNIHTACFFTYGVLIYTSKKINFRYIGSSFKKFHYYYILIFNKRFSSTEKKFCYYKASKKNCSVYWSFINKTFCWSYSN